MTSRWLITGVGVVLVTSLLAWQPAAGPKDVPPNSDRLLLADVDLAEIARMLVNKSARVKEGEFVHINGGVRDLELLEDVAIATRRLGAWPLVTLSSDRMTRLMYDDVPASFDDQRPELAVRMVGLFPVNINIAFSENDRVLEGVSPGRIAAQGEAAQPVADLAREFNVRTINLGNDFYPTEQRAAMFGISLDELAEIFWAGVNVDYQELRQTGLVVKRVLEQGHTLRITNPNGTDLTVQLGGKDVLISDGVVSIEDERLGGAATTVWLPAGEVFTAPLAGTAQGVIVADHFFYQGHRIEGLRLEFVEGKLTAMTADKGLDIIQASYDVAGEGRDRFAVIDIGINPNIQLQPGSSVLGWVPAGMVTVGVGNNAWAGGANNVNFAIYPFLPGSTVEVDGVVVVDGGVLQTGRLLGMK
ncbi:MAG: aminopeptidase [Gemmatimonadetes bacterium]|nr:aminopeptidase [Gemmatimonadota bacterium]